MRFNSRTREGCDPYLSQWLSVSYKFQFTHPRGVRLKEMIIDYDSVKFQFTHPRGVRRAFSIVLVSCTLFQFTHPRGVRPRIGHLIAS